MAMALNVSSDVEHVTYHSRLQQYNVSTTKVFARYKTLYILDEDLVPDEDLCGRNVLCNPLCCGKCSRSLLTCTTLTQSAQR